jgi:acyl-CoA synthetase (NDP forming)
MPRDGRATPTTPGLARVLAPRSVVLFGTAPAAAVIRQCRRLGFTGPLWPVHPTRDEIAGIPCVRHVDELPGVPDAAFVAVNRRATIDVVATLARLGVGGAVCYASGFAESGPEGVALQARLVEAAGDMPLLGPNCYGVINALDGVALWPDEHGCGRVARGVAIVSQSGNVGLNLTLQQRGVPLAFMVTVGNQAVAGVEDCLEAFVAEPRVSAIGLFVEAIIDPVRFARLSAAAAARGVRIVALQAGKSDAGAAIAASHTASLAGRRTAYEALLARCGVATVGTPAELLEALKVLHHGGPLTGPRLVSLSCSGGEASLVADLAEAGTLRFAPFPDEQRGRIAATLTELVTIGNPFDYHTFMWGDRAAMGRTFGEVLDGPHDATMLVLDAPPRPDQDASSWEVAAHALADAARRTGRRAAVVATLSECLTPGIRAAAESAGIVALQGLREALIALEAAAWLAAHAPGEPPAPVTQPGATRVLDEDEGKALVAGWGVAVPEGVRCARADVASAAARIGWPVTLKGLGIAHKSEAGAVRVGIPGPEALVAAAIAMPPEVRECRVEHTIVGTVAEVLVTVRRDAPVGWLVTLGAGGVETELRRDTASLLAPVTGAQVEAALGRLRIAPVLRGHRGRPAAAVPALVALVERLVAGARSTGVVEVELNPVLVTPDAAVAVDALVTVEA